MSDFLQVSKDQFDLILNHMFRDSCSDYLYDYFEAQEKEMKRAKKAQKKAQKEYQRQLED